MESLLRIRYHLRLLRKLKKLREIVSFKDILSEIIFDRPCNPMVLKNGFKIYHFGERIIFKIFYDIFVSEEYTSKFLKIENGDTVVDIGAHIGLFTIFAKSKAKCKIYCYEPHPQNFQMLIKNIEENKLEDVFAYPFAVSNSSGIEKLYLNGQSTLHSMVPSSKKNYINVKSVTLSEIFESNNLNRINFLKMDCEGKEFDIILSTPKNLLKRIDKISLEFHEESTNYNQYDLQKYLSECGFKVIISTAISTPLLGHLFAWQIR